MSTKVLTMKGEKADFFTYGDYFGSYKVKNAFLKEFTKDLNAKSANSKSIFDNMIDSMLESKD